MRKSKGFTLIELLVVIAIIALLLSILMPSLQMARESANRLICGTYMKTIGLAIYMYAEEHDDYLPYPSIHLYRMGNSDNLGNPIRAYFMGDPTDAEETLSPPDRIAAMKYRHKPKTVIPPPWPDPDRVFENLGVILAADMVDLESGKLFYCPSAKEGAFTWDAYGGQGNWPVKRGRLRSGFCYIPQSLTLRGHVNGEKFPNTAVKMSDTNPSLSMLADNLQSAGNVIAHQIGNYIGANLLYGNGAVKFSKDPALTEWYKQNPSGNLMQSPDYRRVLKLMER